MVSHVKSNLILDKQEQDAENAIEYLQHQLRQWRPSESLGVLPYFLVNVNSGAIKKKEYQKTSSVMFGEFKDSLNHR